MSRHVNLLLLFSALLSALTGIGGGARGTQVVQAVAQGSVALATPLRRAAATARPAQQLPTIVAMVAIPSARSLVLRSVHPLYAARRRE
jgi:hypothetical protein